MGEGKKRIEDRRRPEQVELFRSYAGLAFASLAASCATQFSLVSIARGKPRRRHRLGIKPGRGRDRMTTPVMKRLVPACRCMHSLASILASDLNPTIPRQRQLDDTHILGWIGELILGHGDHFPESAVFHDSALTYLRYRCRFV